MSSVADRFSRFRNVSRALFARMDSLHLSRILCINILCHLSLSLSLSLDDDDEDEEDEVFIALLSAGRRQKMRFRI